MSFLTDQLPRYAPLSDAAREALRESKVSADFTYAEVGATAGELPVGYRHVDRSWELGRGAECFEAARDALFAWEMLPSWTRVHPDPVTAPSGSTLVLELKLFGLWWVSCVRLLPAEGCDSRASCASQTYGTLPGHHGRGEERFEVAHLADDRVVYRLRSFSRWQKVLPRLAPALARRLQDRFATDSAARLIAALAARRNARSAPPSNRSIHPV